MAANIEIEAKVLITEEEYNIVVDKYKDLIEKEYFQVNYYIDTKDFKLKQLGIGLRIRNANDVYTLTLKAPMAEGLLEKDQVISKEAYQNMSTKRIFPEGNIKDFVVMLGIDIEELSILVSLKTHRMDVIDKDEATTFSIDKNRYSGLIDYELEVEGDSLNRAVKRLQDICEECNIKYVDNPHSKQSRAMSTIK